MENWVEWAGLRWNMNSDECNIYFYILHGHILYSECLLSDRQITFISCFIWSSSCSVCGLLLLYWCPQQVQSDLHRMQTELQPDHRWDLAAAAHLVLCSNKIHNQRVNIRKISCVFNGYDGLALDENLLSWTTFYPWGNPSV